MSLKTRWLASMWGVILGGIVITTIASSSLSIIGLGLLLLPLLGFIVWRLVNDMVRELTETQRRLAYSEKMAAVSQLAAGVGHEINNPITYVSANLGFATEILAELSGTSRTADSPPLPPEVAEQLREVSEALREAQDGAQRVARIVRDLRTFAQPGNAAGQLVEIRSIIESALKLASNPLLLRARVFCDFQVEIRVRAPEARLVQVFMNLLVNAAQAIPPGHVEENEVRVTTSLGTEGFIVVEVSDTGQGMPPEVLKRLFEPFFTTKPVGQGTGLGLSICRNVIEGMGGTLTVRSTVGKGSAFRITLPEAGPLGAQFPQDAGAALRG
ncbi:sensor histidine kinase [Hyalangium minutum]|uniref:histidine kinase n=1 Tax=Hyalangium minutum TaxID=394096 RepID=A0A085WQF0_9BACT|nr:ATP-binding protein [Hyalangium minutum]KFE69913.1 hypothetical protein DB31_4955 [Hyalangium minutum]